MDNKHMNKELYNRRLALLREIANGEFPTISKLKQIVSWQKIMREIIKNQDKPCQCKRIIKKNTTTIYTCKYCIARLIYSDLERTINSYKFLVNN